VFVAAVFFVGISFLVDLLYTLLDPHICYEVSVLPRWPYFVG